ncbi:hypothetical protein KAFR_0H02220 [Kazachstania africana CBS 2517]|uniref:Choline kinase N-terminal domain-containing protein n=1 Tax=Kazachstania africana (strain ATCC 22294 / BCRC 22015 / CBS 2517 / CECT 1963 / NBRC 1671 / NRRL Y-8276) TaxID=1071382 RepID=H2AZ75_KAZAF|nr:hypothetical protein KAFR_0H02220 [Kazachstania africana CBS 2517]CCF59631.1 hypothetical protein KAFR_0H02220 [Kazachstania africana CBS 2517]
MVSSSSSVEQTKISKQYKSGSPKRPSLTRKRSSQRLIRTISIETDDEEYLSPGLVVSDALTEVHSGSVVNTLPTGELDQIDNKADELPNLTSLKIANENTHKSNDYIEVPFVKASLDATLPEDYLRNDIWNVIQALKIPRWHNRQNLILDRLKLIKISGAMTNAIFKIEYPKLPSLLLRIYGSNNDLIIDRDYELEILARLSVRNIGPSLFGCFTNGRFEQFLENSTTLTFQDLRDWKTSQRIARRMKELHNGVPLLKAEIEDGPVCWKKINNWVNILDSKQWVHNDENIKKVFHCQDWEFFKKVVKRYYDWLLKSNFYDSKMVFCHNDAQYGNLLFSAPVVEIEDDKSSVSSTKTTASSLFPSNSNVHLDRIINPPKQERSQDSKLVVIDFEYAGANPAAYDLANHLSEWMYNYTGKEPHRTLTSEYPTKEQILNFLYSYVSHLRGGSSSSSSSSNIDHEVKYYYNLIIKWRATVQIFWSLWGVLQSGVLEEKDTEIIFEGTNGEKYIIKEDPDASFNDDVEDHIIEGVSIDTFDYLKYCSDKIAVFWGDLIKLQIIDESDCMKSKMLDTQLI